MYVLTLLIVLGSNLSIVTQEYKTQASCEAALDSQTAVNSPFRFKTGMVAQGICTLK